MGECFSGGHPYSRTDNVSSVEASIREDVALLKASPMINSETEIVGLKYDIDTGLLTEITD